MGKPHRLGVLRGGGLSQSQRLVLAYPGDLEARTGGYLYDRAGSYDGVWAIAIGLSALAALVNLPIREQPVRRLRAA